MIFNFRAATAYCRDAPEYQVTHLIDDVLPRSALVALVGPHGSGKSFLALDLAMSLATATAWHQRPVTPVDVLYLVGEGQRAFPRRVRAWCDAKALTVPDSLMLSNTTVGFGNASRENAMFAELAAARDGGFTPSLIVVDTLQAHVAPGFDENHAKDMGDLVDSLVRLRNTFDATVLVLHHPPHNGTRARGSGVLGDRCDVVMELAANGDARVLRCTKHRDEEPFAPLPFVLRPHLDSAVLESTQDAPPTVVTEKARQLLAALSNEPRTFADWHKASGHPKASFDRLRQQLASAELVSLDDRKRYRITPAGQTALVQG